MSWPPSDLRGRLIADAPLGPRTWFRTGGAADWLFIPEDDADLARALAEKPAGLPVTVLGACSNVIIRDGGVEGLVIRLMGGFSAMTADGDGIIAGAAALDANVAQHAAGLALTGLEFLAGIPGSIGGAVRMNAGAYGSDIATVLDWAEVMLPSGETRRLTADALRFAYRRSELPPGAVVLRARLRGQAGDKTAIDSRIADIRRSREESQPVRARTGGSTFRNPPGHKAWELIDQAGCRGMRIGDAQVSEKHCNFLLNLGAASSHDLEELGEKVRRRVMEKSGIELHWEIKRIGRTDSTRTRVL